MANLRPTRLKRLCKKCSTKGEKYPRKNRRHLKHYKVDFEVGLLNNPTLVHHAMWHQKTQCCSALSCFISVKNKISLKNNIKGHLQYFAKTTMSAVIHSVSAKAAHRDDAWKEIMGSQLTRADMLPHTKVARQWVCLCRCSKSLRSSIPCQQSTHLYQTYTLKLVLQEVQFEVL